MNKEKFYSVLGIGFLALFLATLLDPFPDKVTLKCNRSNGICVIETTDLYRTNRGVMMTPGLYIDGEAKAVGRVPSTEEIKKMLKK